MKQLIFLLLAVQMARGQSMTPPMQSEPQARPNVQVHLRSQDGGGLKFTLKQAEAYALANHPQIAAANLTAEAVRQQIREARSEFFPQVSFDSTSVYAPDYDSVPTRLAALGGLNNPSAYSRQSDGVTINQLITDFGHTYDLTEAAHFRADAATDRTNDARAIVILAVDRAYFDLLRAKAVLRVSADTVQARQIDFNKISDLAKNKIESTLDANLAQVNLSESQLLFIGAKSGVSKAEAALAAALGFGDTEHFMLTEEPLTIDLPDSPDDLIHQALNKRPELASLRNETEAARRFAEAQDTAQYPKVSAMAAGGVNAVADSSTFHKTYYAAGINVEVPLFNGGDLAAKAKEAHLLMLASAQNLVDAQNTISRDVRVAWLDANTAKERLNVTAQLVQAALESQTLAEERYKLGSSSIVELTEAELDYTQAQLQNTSAKYDYQNGRALLNFATGSSF